jgi:hypothetical protein
MSGPRPSEERCAFRITGGKGIHFVFPNGWTFSIQFGPGNYGDNYHASFLGPSPESGWQSNEAECWAWCGPGQANSDPDVKGYLSMEEVLAYMDEVRARPSIVPARAAKEEDPLKPVIGAEFDA